MMKETYNNGPEGMPKVERMSDSTIDWVINPCDIDGLIRNERGYQQLRAIAHAVAEEVLARVPAWSKPIPAAVEAPSEAEKLAALKKVRNEAMEAAEKAAYAYFRECYMGLEREKASEIYENLRNAGRVY
jgi:hypothetical protein